MLLTPITDCIGKFITRSKFISSFPLTVAVGQPAYNQAAPPLPDPSITPGDALPVTREDICTPGYSKKVRNVPQAVKAGYRAARGQ